MGHTLRKIENAINSGDFKEASKLLKHYEHSIDDLNIKTKEGAEYIGDYIKTYLPNFSIAKTTLIKSLGDFLDKYQIKGLFLFSPDIHSLESDVKLQSMDCFLDNKQSKQYYNDHKCLKKVLGEADYLPPKSDTLSILAAHTKCEPGVKCHELKEHFTMLYNLHPIVAKVMDVSAKACEKDKCHIVFTNDANYSSKNASSPNVVTTGYYNGDSDIFISSNRDKYDYYGTFIHELTHYTMNSLYRYSSNPYPDVVSKMYSHLHPKGFKYISNSHDYKAMAQEVDTLLQTKSPMDYEQSRVQDTIKGLRHWYDAEDYDCELVVRYPHMIAANYDEKNVDYYLKPIEDYFNSHIIPDMDNYLVA